MTLNGGTDGKPTLENYLDAIQSMGDEPEVALVVMPDLFNDICNDDDRLSVLAEAVALADSKQDRLVLVDVPCKLSASTGHHLLGRAAPGSVHCGEHGQ